MVWLGLLSAAKNFGVLSDMLYVVGWKLLWSLLGTFWVFGVKEGHYRVSGFSEIKCRGWEELLEVVTCDFGIGRFEFGCEIWRVPRNTRCRVKWV